MEERISWLQRGSEYRRVEGNISNVDNVPIGIYQIGLDMKGFYLEYYSKEFLFDFKVYGLEEKFINHVITTYKNSTGNLVVLMNGIRGTGKTVSSKVLANRLNLPVIIVKSFGDQNQNMMEWFAGFNFDCVFLFDEFEKNFSDKDSSILQIMDGVYTSKFRRMFILTTNQTNINENLISRPSRLRYIKEFGNLSREVVSEILADTLNDKSYSENLLDYIDTLKISTIDIVKAIVSEVNIFGFKEFMETKSYFNVETEHYSYTCRKAELSESYKTSINYKISDFLEDCKKAEKRYQLTEPMRKDFKTDEEYDVAYLAYCDETRGKANCYTYTITGLDKPFKSMKIGDYIDDCDEQVIAVDIPNNVFVTLDRWNEYRFYLVKNPDSKPSLYKPNNQAIAYVL
jgi:broad-specificity NMP kinase